MAKTVNNIVKLQVPAGTMAPTPALGSVLGPQGINMMEFFKQLAPKTQDIEKGTPVPVILTVYSDRSFSFVTKQPPVSYFLKKAAKLDKGSQEPGRSFAGEITRKQVEEIATAKQNDLNSNDIEAAMAMIMGSAKSMGLKIVD